jgi:hypothetical protein
MSLGPDAFYTPPWLAELIASSMPTQLKGRVLDPTVGAGALLGAVEDRFGGEVQPLGIDIDARTIATLRFAQPGWTLSNADVLHARSRRSASAWKAAQDDLAAVVLNPPFSYRGNGGPIVSFGEFRGRVAPSVHFLVEALQGLNPAHGFYVVLPNGAVLSERHLSIWNEIRRNYLVEEIEHFRTNSFKGARVSTMLVRLTADPSGKALEPIVSASKMADSTVGCRCVEVIRGRVPVHRAQSDAVVDPVPFLHTTSLSKLSEPPTAFADRSKSDVSPLLIITRVGRWVAPVSVEIGRVVLSDCLIGLRPRDRSLLGVLERDLIRSEASFRNIYRGTGAQYTTLKAITAQLESLNWHPHVLPAGSLPGHCCCGEIATCESAKLSMIG